MINDNTHMEKKKHDYAFLPQDARLMSDSAGRAAKSEQLSRAAHTFIYIFINKNRGEQILNRTNRRVGLSRDIVLVVKLRS